MQGICDVTLVQSQQKHINDERQITQELGNRRTYI